MSGYRLESQYYNRLMRSMLGYVRWPQVVLGYLLTMHCWSCIDRVELPIRSEPPQLVVEGQITNEAPPYTVRLAYTGHYGSTTGLNPADQFVIGAQLTLANDQGRSTGFVMTAPGVYQTTDSSFRGQIGRSYSLTIVLNSGQRYVSQAEKMPGVSPIDSISAQIVRTENYLNPYQVAYTITTQDPAREANYYRWTAYGIVNRLSQGVACCTGCNSVCYNSCWTPVSGDMVNIYSDAAINGNPIRHHFVLQLPIYSYAPQLVEVQQYGLTQANYRFWQLYRQQSARTGSIFDPLPAPVTGNVINATDPVDIARGYFAVTSVRRQRLVMQNYLDMSLPFYRAMQSFFYSQQLILPSGDCRDTYGPSLLTEPEGWR